MLLRRASAGLEWHKKAGRSLRHRLESLKKNPKCYSVSQAALNDKFPGNILFISRERKGEKKERKKYEKPNEVCCHVKLK